MKRLSLAQRLLTRVEKNADGCWYWTGRCTPGGYGSFKFEGKHLSTHRVSYELHIGPIPIGLHVDHLCRHRTCCNPLHLEPVTPAVNKARGIGFPGVNPLKTHCPQGHPYDDTNTITGRRGDGRTYRRCRICAYAATARSAAAKTQRKPA